MKKCVTVAALLLALAAIAEEQRSELSFGVPLYKGAIAKPEGRGEGSDRATLSFRGIHVQEAAAEKYVTNAPVNAVLDFYRAELKRFGNVTECTGGANEQVSVSLNESSVNNVGECRSEEFGAGETELKTGTEKEFHIVTARTVGSHTEFTLVRVRKGRGKHPADI